MADINPEGWSGAIAAVGTALVVAVGAGYKALRKVKDDKHTDHQTAVADGLVKTLQDTIEKYSKRVDELTERVDKMAEERNRAREEAASLKAKVQILEAKVSGLENELAEAEVTIKSLKEPTFPLLHQQRTKNS